MSGHMENAGQEMLARQAQAGRRVESLGMAAWDTR